MTRKMADRAHRDSQEHEAFAPHIAPVNALVDRLRSVGRGWVPYVAPAHGGVDARVLSILRDPGPATRAEVGSGFLSTENDDPSAEFQAEQLRRVGLGPEVLLPWNAYPWYIDRAPKAAEARAGLEPLTELLALLPQAQVVLLQGRDAAAAWRRLRRERPEAIAEREFTVIETFHPSRHALRHRDPAVRERRSARRLAAFDELAEVLASS